MMVANWVTVLQHDPMPGLEAQICASDIFSMATYQEPSKEQQKAFKKKITTCAHQANKLHRKFFIVTDKASAPYLRQLFGKTVTLAY